MEKQFRMFQKLNSSGIGKKISELSKPREGVEYIINRNPRNLERLRIAYKPAGYHLEKPGRNFWYKLELKASGRYVYAEVKHFEDGPVITANTSEWAIKKQLFRTKDTCAYINLARVVAQRCLMAGLSEMACDINPVTGGKVEKFLKTLEENGLRLSEPTRFLPHKPWHNHRPEKPWEVIE